MATRWRFQSLHHHLRVPSLSTSESPQCRKCAVQYKMVPSMDPPAFSNFVAAKEQIKTHHTVCTSSGLADSGLTKQGSSKRWYGVLYTPAPQNTLPNYRSYPLQHHLWSCDKEIGIQPLNFFITKNRKLIDFNQ